jgi:hypothetical protein
VIWTLPHSKRCLCGRGCATTTLSGWATYLWFGPTPTFSFCETVLLSPFCHFETPPTFSFCPSPHFHFFILSPVTKILKNGVLVLCSKRNLSVLGWSKVWGKGTPLPHLELDFGFPLINNDSSIERFELRFQKWVLDPPLSHFHFAPLLTFSFCPTLQSKVAFCLHHPTPLHFEQPLRVLLLSLLHSSLAHYSRWVLWLYGDFAEYTSILGVWGFWSNLKWKALGVFIGRT